MTFNQQKWRRSPFRDYLHVLWGSDWIVILSFVAGTLTILLGWFWPIIRMDCDLTSDNEMLKSIVDELWD